MTDSSNNNFEKFPATRLRRMRAHDWSRRLMAENAISTDDLIWPLFVREESMQDRLVPSMPGVTRLNRDEILRACERALDLGIPAVALFPYTDNRLRDEAASEATNPDNLICRTVQTIKKAFPDLGVMCDVALDPYTSHGQDGLVSQSGEILNDETVDVLVRQAVVQADAGCDIIAPSDMMDGRIGAIRQALEHRGHKNTLIMSYAAKYASAFYGPFREAVGSQAILKGDKESYQMDPANRREALREVALDLSEGADIILVKPGLPYLDVIRDVKDSFGVPVCAYQVSGEYAMIKAASANNWIDEEAVVIESLLSFKRAGCDAIISYFAPMAAGIIRRS